MIGCEPTDRVLIEKDAVAELAPDEAKVCVASTVEPSEKMTEPVGAPGVEVLVTVAVRVTG